MVDASRTAIEPRCNKCGKELGSAYIYGTDGKMCCWACFPASPSATRIAQLERELAEARAQSVGDWSTQRENDALTIKYYELKDERDRLAAEVEGAMRQLTSTAVAQYLLANTRSRSNGPAKAHWHKELTICYVAAFRNCEPDRVRRRYEADYNAVHDATARELTDKLDVAIGFDLDGFVDDDVQKRFFQAFHRIARASLQNGEKGE